MKDLFSELLLDKTLKSAPDVWFEKVVLYRDVSSEPTQTLSLRKGLNVIQAGVDSALEDISGHGTGKTTFCRMLRYLLGEPTFANKHDSRLIAKVFQKGCIAAVLHVGDKEWAVRRPFGDSVSYVAENGSIEDVLSMDKNGIGKNQYIHTLGLDSFCDSLRFRDERQVQWGHLLAWMTRDQEARLANIHKWRDPDSESESPSFKNHRQDPLFLMRAALGLLGPDELFNENELNRLEKQKKETEEKVTSLEAEPDHQIQEWKSRLRDLLKQVNARYPEFIAETDETIDTLPWKSDTLFPTDSLEKISREYEKKLSGRCENLRQEHARLSGSLKECSGLLALIQARIKKTEAAKLISSDVLTENENARFIAQPDPVPQQTSDLERRLAEYKKNIETISEEFCEYGQIDIGDCDYYKACVKNQIKKIEQDAPKTQSPDSSQTHPTPGKVPEKVLIDRHASEQAEAAALAKKERAEQFLAVCIPQRDLYRRQLEEFQSEVQKFKENLVADDELLKNIREAIQKILEWVKKRRYDPDLVNKKNELALTTANITKTRQHLTGLIETHRKNTETMTSVFDRLIKSVLSPDSYRGLVELTDDRELSFQILSLENPRVSIAINVLKTVLVDIASLIYASITDNAIFPRFLIHDSPREADLQMSHYNAMFSILPVIQALFCDQGGVPFQYIITTTTPPPEHITAEFLALPVLDARDTNKIFLKCRLEEEYRKEQERDTLTLTDSVK